MSQGSNSKYYSNGSTARKIDYIEDYPEYVKKRKKITSNYKKNSKKEEKNSYISLSITVSCMFVMLLIVTYRYNVINEKVANVQEMEAQIIELDSTLSNLEMQVEQTISATDIVTVAKQQLGMQKRDDSQVVYIDTLEEKNNENISNSEISSYIEEFLNKIKGIINKVISNN